MIKKDANLRLLLDIGVMPLIRTPSTDEALRMAEAIYAGNVTIIEITMTIPNALGLMEILAKKFNGSILLAAGTVLDGTTARQAIEAGAQVIVSPCSNKDLIQVCRRYSAIVIPGAATPTEILTAWEMGADIVKVFPAGILGGPKYIKAIRAPLPQILLNPTGGVTLENAAEFIKAGASLISVGSALVDQKLIAEKRYKLVTERVKHLVETVRNARMEAC